MNKTDLALKLKDIEDRIECVDSDAKKALYVARSVDLAVIGLTLLAAWYVGTADKKIGEIRSVLSIQGSNQVDLYRKIHGLQELIEPGEKGTTNDR